MAFTSTTAHKCLVGVWATKFTRTVFVGETDIAFTKTSLIVAFALLAAIINAPAFITLQTSPPIAAYAFLTSTLAMAAACDEWCQALWASHINATIGPTPSLFADTLRFTIADFVARSMICIRTVVRALSIIMYRASRPGETIVAGACAIDIVTFAIATAIFWATTCTTVGSRVSCRANAATFSACTMPGAFWFTGAFLRAVCACDLLRAVGPVETFVAQTHTFQADPLIRAIAWALLLGNFVLFNYFVNNLTTFP